MTTMGTNYFFYHDAVLYIPVAAKNEVALGSAIIAALAPLV